MHAPIKEKRIKRDRQPDWFTDEIKSLIYAGDRFHKSKNVHQYKILRNRIFSMIKKNKKEFFNKAVSENKNSKHLWKHLTDITHLNNGKDIVLLQCITTDNTVINGKVDIINELNRHFVNISNIIIKTKFANENFNSLKEKLDSDLGYYIFEIAHITPLEV